MLSVLTFRTPAEAIAKANNTPYGLSAGIWSDKGSPHPRRRRQAARRRHLGQHLQPVRPGVSPFGGYKESGYGREGGRHGLAAYLQGESRSTRSSQGSTK